MRVLVVGGAGYVGGAVTDLLLDSAHDVRVFDNLLYEESYRKPVSFVFGDVRNASDILPHLVWADAVVWLAALVGDGACALHPDVTLAINQDSVEYLARQFDGRIIYMSTCSVYGAQDRLLDESSPTDPLSLYASTKLAGERALSGKDAISFRLGTLFGVGDVFSRIRLDLVVNVLTVRAHLHGLLTVFGGGQYRPLLHVRDAAQAVVDNLETVHRGVFNLHSLNTRIIDLAEIVASRYSGVKIETTPMRFQDVRNYRASSAKAERAWGFKPRLTVEDGIDEIRALLEESRLRDLENPRYTNQQFLDLHATHLGG